MPLLDRRLIVGLKAHKLQQPRSGDGDALFWPGRTPGSHRVDYSRVWDLASFHRNYVKPTLTRAELPAIRVYDLRATQRPVCGSRRNSAVPVQPLTRPRERCYDGHDLLPALPNDLRAAHRAARAVSQCRRPEVASCAKCPLARWNAEVPALSARRAAARPQADRGPEAAEDAAPALRRPRCTVLAGTHARIAPR